MILSSSSGLGEAEVFDVTGRARAFYYKKVSGQEVDWSEYLKYKQNQSQSIQVETASSANVPPDASEDPQLATQKPSHNAPSILNGAPAPISFSELADLIVNNQTHLIPNNEAVPSILNEETPSASKATIRKKPWEAAQITTSPSIQDVPVTKDTTVGIVQ